MLLFIYLCDNCDIAGFIEINYKRWSSDLGSSIEVIKGACEGLQRGLIYSDTKDCIFIKNFLKHQKNYPLNENNMAHLGILKRFELYKTKFNYANYNELIQAPLKGLPSPIGIGNGINIGNILKTWREDFNIYFKECCLEYKKVNENLELIKTQERLNPGVNVKLSIEKGFSNFWSKEAGWKHKKKSKSIEIDWESTIINSIGLNKVYYSKQELTDLQK